MRVGKGQLIKAIISYAEEEMLPQITHRPTQFMLAFCVNMVKVNPKMADQIFENPLIKMVLNDDGSGQYDIDIACKAMTETMKTYGGFPVNLPGVPLLKIPENLLTFTDSDVAAIRKRIEEGNN